MPTMTPAAAKLPTLCFAHHPSTNETILIIRGEDGYYPIDTALTPEQLNAARPEPPSLAQIEAMLAGSLFGWDKPIADPACHVPLDTGLISPSPAAPIPRVADWGGPGTQFRLDGCEPIRPEPPDTPDPFWTYAAGHLAFYGWLRVANRHAKRTFLHGLLQLPARNWRDAYDGRVPPDEAADVAIDEHVAQHGTGPIAAADPLPPIA